CGSPLTTLPPDRYAPQGAGGLYQSPEHHDPYPMQLLLNRRPRSWRVRARYLACRISTGFANSASGRQSAFAGSKSPLHIDAARTALTISFRERTFVTSPSESNSPVRSRTHAASAFPYAASSLIQWLRNAAADALIIPPLIVLTGRSNALAKFIGLWLRRIV